METTEVDEDTCQYLESLSLRYSETLAGLSVQEVWGQCGEQGEGKCTNNQIKQVVSEVTRKYCSSRGQ